MKDTQDLDLAFLARVRKFDCEIDTKGMREMWVKVFMRAIFDVIDPRQSYHGGPKLKISAEQRRQRFSYLRSRDFREVASLAGFDADAVAERLMPFKDDLEGAAAFLRRLKSDEKKEQERINHA